MNKKELRQQLFEARAALITEAMARDQADKDYASLVKLFREVLEDCTHPAGERMRHMIDAGTFPRREP